MNDDPNATVQCRAKLTDGCYSKMEFTVESIYGALELKMSDDRTFDPRSEDVVCDSCYVVMGAPPFETLDDLNAIVDGHLAG